MALALWPAAGGRPAEAPRPAGVARGFGAGASAALPETALAPARFAVPVGGHASLRVALPVAPGGDAPADALVALLGVPGEWPLESAGGPGLDGLALELASSRPGLGSEASPVPEPSALALVLLGTAGLAAWRRPGRRPAGHGPPPLSP